MCRNTRWHPQLLETFQSWNDFEMFERPYQVTASETWKTPHLCKPYMPRCWGCGGWTGELVWLDLSNLFQYGAIDVFGPIDEQVGLAKWWKINGFIFHEFFEGSRYSKNISRYVAWVELFAASLGLVSCRDEVASEPYEPSDSKMTGWESTRK